VGLLRLLDFWGVLKNTRRFWVSEKSESKNRSSRCFGGKKNLHSPRINGTVGPIQGFGKMGLKEPPVLLSKNTPFKEPPTRVSCKNQERIRAVVGSMGLFFKTIERAIVI
jgi:hypothetical protein